MDDEKKTKIANFLEEIKGMNEAEQIDYYINYFNNRKASNREIILKMALIKQAIVDGNIPMPTGEDRINIYNDLIKMKEELQDIESTLKELYEIDNTLKELYEIKLQQ